MKYNVRKFEETIIELIKGSEIKMVIKYMKKKCNICGHIVTTGAVMCIVVQLSRQKSKLFIMN